MDKFPHAKSTTVFGENSYQILNKFIAKKSPSKIFILCTENTHKHCITSFYQHIFTAADSAIITVNKEDKSQLPTLLEQLKKTFFELGGNKNALLINLGGNFICQLGRHLVSQHLQGVSFIEVPTTLYSMLTPSDDYFLDTNNSANLRLIDIQFIHTLSQNQLKNGLVEMLRYGLIADENYWEKLSDLSQLNLTDLEVLIKDALQLKQKIMIAASNEVEGRKKLQFGTELTPILLTYFATQPEKKPLSYGEALAAGILVTSYLSLLLTGFSERDLTTVKQVLLHSFKKIALTQPDITAIIELVNAQKPSTSRPFTLLTRIGYVIIDQPIPNSMLEKSLTAMLLAESV